jgi:hypothetical protein
MKFLRRQFNTSFAAFQSDGLNVLDPNLSDSFQPIYPRLSQI